MTVKNPRNQRVVFEPPVYPKTSGAMHWIGLGTCYHLFKKRRRPDQSQGLLEAWLMVGYLVAFLEAAGS